MQERNDENDQLTDVKRSNRSNEDTDEVYDIECHCHDEKSEKEKSNSILITYFVVFVMCTEYGIVIPTLWPYLRKVDPNVTTFFFGLTASAHSIGHFLFAFLFGYWVEKRNAKEPLVFSVSIMIIGCIIYAYAETVSGSTGNYMVLISRSAVGLVAGSEVAQRTFLTRSVTAEEKSRTFGNLSMSGALGFFGGLGFQLMLVFVKDYDLEIDVIDLHLNIYTAPAFMGTLLSVLALAALLIWFKEGKHIKSQESLDDGSYISPDKVAMAANLVLFFSNQFCYTAYETLLSPMLIDEFSLDNKDAIFYASVLFFIGLVVVLVGFQAAKHLINRLDVARVTVIGCVLLLATFVVILPWGSEHPELQKVYVIVTGRQSQRIVSNGCSLKYSWCMSTPQISIVQLVIYSILISLAYPVMHLSQLVMMSEILSPRNQGYYIALVSSCVPAARIIGALVTMYFYGTYGPRWTFLFIDSFLIIVIIILIATYRRFVPYDKYVESIVSS